MRLANIPIVWISKKLKWIIQLILQSAPKTT